MIIGSGKGNKDRLIPLHKALTELLDKYLEQRLPLENKIEFEPIKYFVNANWYAQSSGCPEA